MFSVYAVMQYSILIDEWNLEAFHNTGRQGERSGCMPSLSRLNSLILPLPDGKEFCDVILSVQYFLPFPTNLMMSGQALNTNNS